MTERIEELFREQGAKPEFVVPRRGQDIRSIARGLVKEGRQTVVAGGGDGTVSAVAAALVGTRVSLGVLPLGTLNHFAKDLGIPLDLESAVDNVLTGETVQVDVGDVNGHVFINNSSIGLYPAIVQERSDHQSRGYSKWVAFIRAVYTVMRRCPSFHASLHADGVSKGGDHTPFVFVGNNRYETSGLRIGERGTLRAGRLWVARAPGADRAVLLRMAVQAALGHAGPGELKVLEAEELWVQSRRSHLKVANDGELQSFTSPLHYRILPGALQVIVPGKAATEDA